MNNSWKRVPLPNILFQKHQLNVQYVSFLLRKSINSANSAEKSMKPS